MERDEGNGAMALSFLFWLYAAIGAAVLVWRMA